MEITGGTSPVTVTFGTALYGQFEFTKKGSGELILEGLDSFASGNVTILTTTATAYTNVTLNQVLTNQPIPRQLPTAEPSARRTISAADTVR